MRHARPRTRPRVGASDGRRRHRWSRGDSLLTVVAGSLVVWTLIPGAGPDILGLGDRYGWGIGGGSRAGNDATALASTEVGAALEALTETPTDEVPTYTREAFGQQWADTDHNGCDTRNDILARDLARPTFKEGTNGCVVLGGTLAEPYTGRIMEFERGRETSSLVQIDHVVALADAWRSGAWEWELGRRQEFANDPLNLLAVEGQANQDKEAGAADLWLPPDGGFRCAYVARQVAVKGKWGLGVTQSERSAMGAVLVTCPDQALPVS